MTSDPPNQPEPMLSNHSLLEEGDDVVTADLELVTEQILADPNLNQYITRRNEDGQDTLVGYFRCQLQRHQQRYALHIPLHPAMSAVPQVEAIVMDSDEASIRVTERQRFGLRVEIVLPRPTTETCSVMVEVIAFSNA